MSAALSLLFAFVSMEQPGAAQWTVADVVTFFSRIGQTEACAACIADAVDGKTLLKCVSVHG